VPDTRSAEVELNLARCRIILSFAAIVAVYIDPTRPILMRWFPLGGGLFWVDPHALAAMLLHLVYSLTVYVILVSPAATPHRVALVSTCADVLFGVLVALVTEGANSPFYVFFAFAVMAAGFRSGLRLTLVVTASSVALYVGLVLVAHPEDPAVYIVRAVYLTITGYLAGYLGERRLILEARLRELETATLREQIARSLHDEFAQCLAGVNVRLEGCRELLRRGRDEKALVELTELQAGVNREHDELRAYIRSLVDRRAPLVAHVLGERTDFTVRAQFRGSLRIVEHTLQIMLEGARNVALHARADSALITADATAEKLLITVDDDGIGFPAGATPPWSIASRAAELGGRVMVSESAEPGGHVEIELPAA
jgi:signal transduction histidine kinase